MKRVDARRNISAAVKYELVVTVDHAAPVQRPKTSRKSLFAKSASFVKRGDSAVAPRSSGSATVTANRSSKSLYSNGSATHARAAPLGITRRELVVRPASRAQGGSYAPTAHSPGPSPSGATAASAPLTTIALPSPAGGPASSGPHSVALPQLSPQTSEESPRPEPEPKPIDEADVTRVFTLSDSCSCYLSDSGSVRMRLQVDRDVCKPGGTLVVTTEAEAVNTYIAFPRLTVECGELVLLQAAPSQEGGKHQPPQVECFKPFWRHELAGLYPKLFARVLKRSARGGAPCRLMVPLPMELQPSLHGRLIQRCVAVQLTASPDETCLIATRPRVLARIAVV
ncbi:hypothetical protein HYH03_013062 [Edaphochlamys debaryana]|uniref:Uncharacterized protein n=1 Tax=Edaphochlamys debaryana TaxID=47281 RepID=A0A835XQG3_9CHLO|nr:hypothetical protein HYH03_013062 [Edaphochlamys debaryana]|eukprot:KAG2488373.1 hypothetical protein HYH03_013062 [Edaphochlamys debaryana]